MPNDSTSNAVEYERRRDAITDLKEDYKAVRALIQVVFGGAVLDTLMCLGCIVYGAVIDANATLPQVMFGISFFLGIILWIGVFAIRDEASTEKRKAIRDAEREFKYWSIENPPC